ncbi:MAG: formate hydrogenlyase maturation HycH family protein [Methylocella sp.]
MPQHVVFYQLSRKFLDSRTAVAAAPKQVVHYTLAIGHHIGVIDCFDIKLEMTLDEYIHWVAQLPDSEGRKKLEGLMRFGEIEISVAHAGMLQNAFNRGLDNMLPQETQWTARLNDMLQDIVEEPALYLMVRRRP